MKSAVIQYWRLEGFFYVARIHFPNGGVLTRTLDFVSYHLIKWIHGEEKLREMAAKI